MKAGGKGWERRKLHWFSSCDELMNVTRTIVVPEFSLMTTENFSNGVYKN